VSTLLSGSERSRGVVRKALCKAVGYAPEDVTFVAVPHGGGRNRTISNAMLNEAFDYIPPTRTVVKFDRSEIDHVASSLYGADRDAGINEVPWKSAPAAVRGAYCDRAKAVIATLDEYRSKQEQVD
jgi:hypothetical protein